MVCYNIDEKLDRYAMCNKVITEERRANRSQITTSVEIEERVMHGLPLRRTADYRGGRVYGYGNSHLRSKELVNDQLRGRMRLDAEGDGHRRKLD